jgi:hypothetical protein
MRVAPVKPPAIKGRDAKLLPSINWVAVANLRRRQGDRLGARECLRLARLMRLNGRKACAPRLP